jgi:hypothetical protein
MHNEVDGGSAVIAVIGPVHTHVFFLYSLLRAGTNHDNFAYLLAKMKHKMCSVASIS